MTLIDALLAPVIFYDSGETSGDGDAIPFHFIDHEVDREFGFEFSDMKRLLQAHPT